MEQNHHLALVEGMVMEYPERYCRLARRLIHLTITRPELSYCVHILAQFMREPKNAHCEAALRVVRYLKLNPGHGILLKSDSELNLTAYCDDDWASCPLSHRFLTAYFVFLGGSPISWKTRKQQTVSRSSAEAEYHSLADATFELKWLKELLSAFGVFYTTPR